MKQSKEMEDFLFSVNQPAVDAICTRMDEVLELIMFEGRVSLKIAKQLACEVIEHKPEPKE